MAQPLSKTLMAIIGAVLLSAAPAASQEQYAVAEISAVGNAAIVGGTVIPYKEVVLAAMVPGQVRFIAGREGDTFAANAQLVQIDDDDLQARRRSAVANLMSRESAMRHAQVQYSRELVSPQINRGMSRSSGMGMPQMFDMFFSRPMSNQMGLSNPWVERYADLHGQASGLSQAQSAILQARAALEEIDAKIKDARVYAPFGGVIIAKMVEEGDTVQPGQPLLKFAYVDYLRLQVEVPMRLVAGLKPGMIIPARIDVGAGVYTDARVAQVYPIADKVRRTVTVKFDLPLGVQGKPGTYAEIRLIDPTAQAKNLPTVPRSALVQRGSLFGVFVRGENGAALKMVRVGGDAGRGRVTILSGLQGGEQVVVNPTATTGQRTQESTRND